MVGKRDPGKIVRDLSPLERRGIEVIKGEVTAIDPATRKIRVAERDIEADYVVVSLGADLAPDRIPGLADAGRNLYSLEGATSIRDARAQITSGHLVVLVAGMPFKCPAAPYEAAMLLDDDLRKRGVRENVSVSVYTPEPGPMGVAGPEMSGAVRGLLEERDIEYRPQHQVDRVDDGTLHFADGSEVHFDHLMYVPPHVAPAPVVDAGLTNEAGWVPVDRATMATQHAGVYAIGDVTTIPLSMGLPLPKAGTFAEGQAKTVAASIAAEINGHGAPGTFDGHGSCFLEIGRGKAAMGSGDFYAEPRPEVKVRRPGRVWHLGKVLFEKWWFFRWT
jgi:sulfide:quinone oxidoreductase